MRQAECVMCGRIQWVNHITYTDKKTKCKVIGELCADCFDKSDAPIIRPPGNDDPSWKENSNPWQENAIRALEDE